MFTHSVIRALKYYVYALIDPRDDKIFYIGKGCGNRVFDHAENTLNEMDKSLKLDQIRSIISSGLKPEYYIVRHNLSEETAYTVESALIDVLTYPKFNTENTLSNIIAGHHQWDEGIKSVNEINSIYDCAEMKIAGNERLLLVNLNKSYDQKKAKGVYKRKDIYEQTRKYWYINIERAKRVDYVLGIYKGVVRAVYRPTKWFSVDTDEEGIRFRKRRWAFDGEYVDNSPYTNKRIPHNIFGSGSAIAYL